MATIPMTTTEYNQAITIARRQLANASQARVDAEAAETTAQHVLDALLWRRPVTGG